MTTPPMNDTIRTQLAHRSIRAFEARELDDDTIATLFEVSRWTASCAFGQQRTIIHVRDEEIRREIGRASGQPYVGVKEGELFIFVADLHRNAQIRREASVDDEPASRAQEFLAAVIDTSIAAQNMVVAAESLGLGTLYLESIAADIRRVIRALDLPANTYPLVGLIVGYPRQEPQLKPRMPLSLLTATDRYPRDINYHEALRDYDAELGEYYDLRDTNRRVDTFTDQIVGKWGVPAAEHNPLLEVLAEQQLAQH